MPANPMLVLCMINAPYKYFEDPSQIANYPGLTRSDRINILRSWKHDVILTMTATEKTRKSARRPKLEDIKRVLREEEQQDD